MHAFITNTFAIYMIKYRKTVKWKFVERNSLVSSSHVKAIFTSICTSMIKKYEYGAIKTNMYNTIIISNTNVKTNKKYSSIEAHLHMHENGCEFKRLSKVRCCMSLNESILNVIASLKLCLVVCFLICLDFYWKRSKEVIGKLMRICFFYA